VRNAFAQAIFRFSDCRFRGSKSVTGYLSFFGAAGREQGHHPCSHHASGSLPIAVKPASSPFPALSIPISPSGKRQRKGKNCHSRRVAPRGWGTTFLSNARHWAHACSSIVSNCTLFLYVHDVFEESWCPLCARPLAGPPREERESLIHILTNCHALAPHATIVATAAHASVVQLGGITLYKDAFPLQWADLPEEVQLGLLMGNRLPCFSYTFQDPEQASAWVNRFLVSTQQPLSALLHSRKTMIRERFPDSLLLPSAQTSARPQPL
jgi:hypothetical protein